METYSTQPSPGAPAIGAIVYPGQDWGNATVVANISGGYTVTGYAGFVDVPDSVPAPAVPMLAQVAAPPSIAPPSITTQAPPTAPLPNLPVLTPQNIVQPLPDITLTVMPAPQPCGMWADVNGWIAANSEIAVLIVLGLAFVVWPRKR